MSAEISAPGGDQTSVKVLESIVTYSNSEVEAQTGRSIIKRLLSEVSFSDQTEAEKVILALFLEKGSSEPAEEIKSPLSDNIF